jgi:hypothetical protein
MRQIGLYSMIVLLGLHGMSSAKTWEVEPGGSIQAAIDSAYAHPGDDVLVWPGTYLESIELRDGVDVTSKEGPDSTTIDGENKGRTVFAQAVDNALFSGFTIAGGDTFSMEIQTGGSTFHIENMVFRSHPDSTPPDSALLYMNGGMGRCDTITIDGNESAKRGLFLRMYKDSLHNLTVKRIDKVGVYVNRNSPDFENLTIDSCGTGLYTLNGKPTVSGGTISNCTTGVEAFADSLRVC